MKKMLRPMEELMVDMLVMRGIVKTDRGINTAMVV